MNRERFLGAASFDQQLYDVRGARIYCHSISTIVLTVVANLAGAPAIFVVLCSSSRAARLSQHTSARLAVAVRNIDCLLLLRGVGAVLPVEERGERREERSLLVLALLTVLRGPQAIVKQPRRTRRISQPVTNLACLRYSTHASEEEQRRKRIAALFPFPILLWDHPRGYQVPLV